MRLTSLLSSRRFPIVSLGIASVVSALASGCAEMPAEQTSSDSEELQADNGLKTINGMKVHNGLASGSGLSLGSGLTSPSGLSSTTGLMTTSDGRITVSYLVRCS